jgi:hypothetical protein
MSACLLLVDTAAVHAAAAAAATALLLLQLLLLQASTAAFRQTARAAIAELQTTLQLQSHFSSSSIDCSSISSRSSMLM